MGCARRNAGGGLIGQTAETQAARRTAPGVTARYYNACCVCLQQRVMLVVHGFRGSSKFSWTPGLLLAALRPIVWVVADGPGRAQSLRHKCRMGLVRCDLMGALHLNTLPMHLEGCSSAPGLAKWSALQRLWRQQTLSDMFVTDIISCVKQHARVCQTLQGFKVKYEGNNVAFISVVLKLYYACYVSIIKEWH